MTSVALPHRTPAMKAEDALWASLSGRVWPRAPAVGLLLSDGGWTRARSGMGLVGPVVAFLVGALRGGWRPARELTYSYSLVWLLVFLVVALAGCGLALWLWSGFVLADLLIFDHPPMRLFPALFGEPTVWDQVRQFLIPHLLSYVLLAALLVGTPMVALVTRGSVTGLLSATRWRAPAAAGAVVAVVAAGVHAGMWTQAFPLLVRPLWTWPDRLGAPDAAGISPVQGNPVLIGLVAGAAAGLWAVLSAKALRRIVGRRYQPIARVEPTRPVRPAWSLGGAVLKSALVILLLAGLVPQWWQGVAAFVVLAAAFIAQRLLLPRTGAGRWWIAKTPVALRLVVAAVVAWLVAWQIGRTAYDDRFGRAVVTGDDFTPLLWAVVAATACMALLMPAPPPGKETGESGRTAGGGGSP